MSFLHEAERRSPLELFHPDGCIERWTAFGGNCPARLLPDAGRRSGECADLVILAPSTAESRNSDWLPRAVHLSIDCLKPGGIMYVMAPAPQRMAVTRMLETSGLRVDKPVLHLPDWLSSYHLVPLHQGPVQYALSELLPASSWKRHLAPFMLRLPAIDVILARQLSSIGLIARRRATQPFRWLNTVAGHTQETVEHVVMYVSRRASPDKAVLHCFPKAARRPSFVAKVALSKEGVGMLANEADALNRLGASAKGAGAIVPTVCTRPNNATNAVRLQTALPGRSAAAVLSTKPDQLGQVVGNLCRWLLAWNQATVSRQVLEYRHLSNELLTPAEELAPHLPHGDVYVDWLKRCAERLIHAPLPFVAAHRDLTMHNILLGEGDQLAIIDWESSSEHAVPLADFYYAIVDAVGATQPDKDRLVAFTACFTAGGAFRDLVVNWHSQMMRMLGISDEWAELSFHACWLHHACNEYRAGGELNQSPFLEIAQRLAARQFSWSRA